MGMQRKNITLTEQQDDWVKAQIESGHLGKDSEYIRDLIRKDQQAKERLTMLRQALLEGESSGESKALDLACKLLNKPTTHSCSYRTIYSYLSCTTQVKEMALDYKI